jgi:membrane protease YdiL (CAAX protease family)
MTSRPLAQADPILLILILFLLSFMGVSLFMVMGSGLVNALWGLNLFEQPSALQDYSNPQVVNINRMLLIFQHIGMFVLPAIIFSALVSTNWRENLGFRKAKSGLLPLAAFILVACLPLINALAWLNEQIDLPDALGALESAFMGMEESAAQLTAAMTGSTSPVILIINILFIAVLPALGEEMIFRGLLIPILRRRTHNDHIAIWISAFLFSAMHMQFYGFIPRMILGGILGYLFVWSKSLWAPILAHFANNALALILLFLVARNNIPEQADTFEPQGTDLILLLVSTGAVIFLLYLFKKRAAS